MDPRPSLERLYTVQVFDGNVDAYSVKHYYLDDAVLARYVKFHTVQWHRHPSMRVEVIGCQGLCTGQCVRVDASRCFHPTHTLPLSWRKRPQAVNET